MSLWRRGELNRYARMVEDIAPLTGYCSIPQIVYSISVSIRFNYIYFETPKAACSTIKRFLIKNEFEDIRLPDPNDANFADFEALHLRDYSPLLNVRQLYPFRKCLENGRFFKFCFVRNPYERVLSAYLDKIVRNRPQASQIKTILGRPASSSEPIGFPDFVEAVCSTPVAMMDPHWKVQYFHTCMDTIAYDLVGKTESFDTDIETVRKATGLDARHLSVFSPHSTGAAEAIDSHYTPRLRKLVRDKYDMDFRVLGYE